MAQSNRKVTLASQYDRGAFLKGKFVQTAKKLSRKQGGLSDKEKLSRINKLGAQMEALSDEELRDASDVLIERVRLKGESLDDVVITAFAILREVSRRTTGLFHYDVQILGGLGLVKGGIAEMATGEGKTLAVSLPAYVFSLAGKGVHVVTVNSYLAERDYEFSKPIFDFLNISIGYLPEGGGVEAEGAKKAAYDCDITYGVGYEYGFDYMRDQLAIMKHPDGGPGETLRFAILGLERPGPDVAQRSLAYAIIDEVDSVLIDEAGSPLLISEASKDLEGFEQAYLAAKRLAHDLVEEEHFSIDYNKRSIKLSPAGKRELFRDRKAVPWRMLRRPWETYVLNALKAIYLFKRDEQYVVDDDAVVIVDEFTGRPFPDRSWREGQHQAVETEEGVEIRAEGESSASMTRQRFYALYDRICGLTGTGSESAGEFWHFFQVPVTPIPFNKPSQRITKPERVFLDHESMYEAIGEEIARLNGLGQPVLVGTRTIKDSEAISEVIETKAIPHQVLTAKQDQEEEDILSRAGEVGSVLIATNMAGRGTHIGLSDEAKDLGGLHVIAVERNESSRIDRQLIGRGARQGQPGSAQSFVSADDYLLKTYSPEVAKKLKQSRAKANGELSSRHSQLFDKVQAAVERERYEGRLRMAERDEWMEDTKATLAR